MQLAITQQRVNSAVPFQDLLLRRFKMNPNIPKYQTFCISVIMKYDTETIIILSLMGEGFMGGIHPPLRFFFISEFVL